MVNNSSKANYANEIEGNTNSAASGINGTKSKRSSIKKPKSNKISSRSRKTNRSSKYKSSRSGRQGKGDRRNINRTVRLKYMLENDFAHNLSRRPSQAENVINDTIISDIIENNIGGNYSDFETEFHRSFDELKCTIASMLNNEETTHITPVLVQLINELDGNGDNDNDGVKDGEINGGNNNIMNNKNVVKDVPLHQLTFDLKIKQQQTDTKQKQTKGRRDTCDGSMTIAPDISIAQSIGSKMNRISAGTSSVSFITQKLILVHTESTRDPNDEHDDGQDGNASIPMRLLMLDSSTRSHTKQISNSNDSINNNFISNNITLVLYELSDVLLTNAHKYFTSSIPLNGDIAQPIDRVSKLNCFDKGDILSTYGYERAEELKLHFEHVLSNNILTDNQANKLFCFYYLIL